MLYRLGSIEYVLPEDGDRIRKVFLDKDRTMGNDQKHNICTNVPSSQTKPKWNSVAFSQQANYTEWATARFSAKLVPTLRSYLIMQCRQTLAISQECGLTLITEGKAPTARSCSSAPHGVLQKRICLDLGIHPRQDLELCLQAPNPKAW
jgi:hypothetical protein